MSASIRKTRKKRNKQTNKKGLMVNSHLQMSEICPMTSSQKDVFEAYSEGLNLMLHGEAGTGKTFIALYLALKSVEEGNHSSIVIVRSAVPGRDLGFMKGDLAEKSAVFENPYKEICSNLFNRGDAYEVLKQKGVVEFITTSYIRGITADNKIIIVDEAQNMSDQELHTIMSRPGENTRIIFCGDMYQDDLTSERKKEFSGLCTFIKIIDIMEEFDRIEFTIEDVVRSGLVKSYLTARRKLKL